MRREEFERTNYKMSYEEYRSCYCPSCNKSDCIHRDAYRRLPKIDGGLSLCPNLQYNTILNDTGVLVEKDGKIIDYRTKDHAIEDLVLQDYDRDELNIIFRNKIYIVL